jgi:nucleotide-binding universal stress UspA family protein
MDTNQKIPAGSIVVGIDTTETARQALAWAVDEATREGRPLTLVHGIGDAVASCVSEERGDVGEVIGLLLGEGRAILDAASAQVRAASPGLEIRTVLRLVTPQAALMALADEAAMLVVGPHLHGQRESLSAASAPTGVADGHVDRAPVAVPGAGDAPGGGILVVVDGHTASWSTLKLAFRHADRWDLPLTVMHCLADPVTGGTMADLVLVDRTARLEAYKGSSMLGFQRSILELVVRELRAAHPQVAVELVLADEAVDQALATAATAMDAVIVSTRHALRASEFIFRDQDPATIRCLTIVQPVPEPAVAGLEVEAILEQAERSVSEQEIYALEAVYAEPAVEPRRQLVPVYVRHHATRHLLHTLAQHRHLQLPPST